MRQKRSLAAIAALSLLSACATIRNGRYQKIPVTSNPPGANVTMGCGKDAPIAGVTPTTISVKRHSLPCQLAFRKDGHQSREIVLQRGVSRAFWANLLWLPILGLDGYAGGGSKCEQGNFFCTTRSDDAVVAFVVGVIPAGICMGIDAGTGAMYTSVPATVNVELQPGP